MDGVWGGMGEVVCGEEKAQGKMKGTAGKPYPFVSGVDGCLKQAIKLKKKRANQKAHSALEIFMV